MLIFHTKIGAFFIGLDLSESVFIHQSFHGFFYTPTRGIHYV